MSVTKTLFVGHTIRSRISDEGSLGLNVEGGTFSNYVETVSSYCNYPYDTPKRDLVLRVFPMVHLSK